MAHKRAAFSFWESLKNDLTKLKTLSYLELGEAVLALKVIWNTASRFYGILHYLSPVELLVKFCIGLVDGLIDIIEQEIPSRSKHKSPLPPKEQEKNSDKKKPVKKFSLSETIKKAGLVDELRPYYRSLMKYGGSYLNNHFVKHSLEKQTEHVDRIQSSYETKLDQSAHYERQISKFKFAHFQFQARQALSICSKKLKLFKAIELVINTLTVIFCTMTGLASGGVHAFGKELVVNIYKNVVRPLTVAPLAWLYKKCCTNEQRNETVRSLFSSIADKVFPFAILLLLAAKIIVGAYVDITSMFGGFLPFIYEFCAAAPMGILEGIASSVMAREVIQKNAASEKRFGRNLWRVVDILFASTFSGTYQFFKNKFDSRFEKINGELGMSGYYMVRYQKNLPASRFAAAENTESLCKTMSEAMTTEDLFSCGFKRSKLSADPRFLKNKAGEDSFTWYPSGMPTFLSVGRGSLIIDGDLQKEFLRIIGRSEAATTIYKNYFVPVMAAHVATISTFKQPSFGVGYEIGSWASACSQDVGGKARCK